MTTAPAERRRPDPVLVWADRVALGAFAVWLVMRATVRLRGSDWWWHLATGRYIWQERSLPTVDFFTFTAPDSPWNNVSWLADLAFYAIHVLGGIPALGALLTVLVCVAVSAIGLSAYRPLRSAVFIPLAIWVVVLHESRFVLRPFLLSSAFAALAVFLIERHRRDGGRVLLWLVPLSWLWSCVHGAFPLVYGLIGAYALEALLQRAPEHEKGSGTGRLRRFGVICLVGIACLIAACIQPYGLQAFGRIGEMLGSGTWRRTIGEWRPMTLYAALDPILALKWYGFVLVGAASFLCVGRRVSVFRACAFLGTLLLAFSANRHLDVFLYVAAPIAALNIHEFLDRRARTPSGLKQPLVLIWTVVTLLGAGTAVHRNLSTRYLDPVSGESRRVHAWAVTPLEYPTDPLRHLQQYPVDGRVFNTFEHGGFLSWHLFPQQVFIDSKGLDEEQFVRYMNTLALPKAFDAMMIEWDLRAVVVALDRTTVVLYKQLLEHSSWQLEHFSAGGYLFTRRRAPRPDLSVLPPTPLQHRPQTPRPAAVAKMAPLPLGALKQARFWVLSKEPLLAEVQFVEAVRASPQAIQPRVQLALLYLDQDEPEFALHLFDPGATANSLEIDLVRTQALLALGRLEEAEAALPSSALPNETLYRLRIDLALAQHNQGRAAAVARRWVRVFQRSSAAHQTLSKVQGLGGNHDAALETARRAVVLAPYDGRAYEALALALTNTGEAAGAQDAMATAAQYNRSAYHLRGDL